MSKSSISDRYDECYSDNTRMYQLGKFFSEIGSADISKWLKNPINTGAEQIHYGTDGGDVKIYCNQFYLTFEQEEYFYDNRFIISFSKFVDAAKKWIELTAQKPEFIIIKFVNDDLIFEPDFRDRVAIKVSDIKFTEEALNKVLKPEIKKGLFCGGLHAIEKSENNDFALKNELMDLNGTKSFDIELGDDFTFNHSVFSNINDHEKLKEYTEAFFCELKNVRMFDLKKRGFNKAKSSDSVLLELDEKNSSISVFIFDKDMNFVTCFPFFGRME